MNRQKGQAVLILILVMTVALGIGISVVQRSLSDISTASKVEQSSRAFSAAEAGIEKALTCIGCSPTSVSFSQNNSSAQVSASDLVPAIPAPNTQQAPLEYPPLAKEEIAHVWLADPTSNLPNCDSGKICYTQPSLDVYWGDSTVSDKAALELTLVYYSGGLYQTKKWYLDNVSATRNPLNNFDTSAVCTGVSLGSSIYQCKKNISLPASPAQLMLIRARLLYNTTSQPFAVQAVGTCTFGCYIPPQAIILTSIGISGATQRKVKLFQVNNVVPPYFDYGIFSAGSINK